MNQKICVFFSEVRSDSVVFHKEYTVQYVEGPEGDIK